MVNITTKCKSYCYSRRAPSLPLYLYLSLSLSFLAPGIKHSPGKTPWLYISFRGFPDWIRLLRFLVPHWLFASGRHDPEALSAIDRDYIYFMPLLMYEIHLEICLRGILSSCFYYNRFHYNYNFIIKNLHYSKTSETSMSMMIRRYKLEVFDSEGIPCGYLEINQSMFPWPRLNHLGTLTQRFLTYPPPRNLISAIEI